MGTRTFVRIVVGVLLAGTVVAPSEAAVVCQKKSGAVVVREACKKKETAADPATFGAARAYACSTSNDGTSVSLCNGRPVKGVLSVVANDTYPGYTCFVMDPSINVDSVLAVASLNGTSSFAGGKINAVIGADGYANYQGCPLNSILVITARHTNAGSSLGLEYAILGVSLVVY